MPPNRHTITQNIIQLRLPTEVDSYLRQEEVSGLFWEKVRPGMEALFDKLCDPEELVRIEQLKLELHFNDWEGFKTEFARTLYAALETELLRAEEQAETKVSRLPVRQARFSDWLYFLEKGHFPPKADPPPPEELHLSVLEMLGHRQEAVIRLRKLLQENANAWQRLLRQHPPFFLRSLIELYTGHKQDHLPGFVQELPAIIKALSVADRANYAIAFQEDFLREPGRSFWRAALATTVLEKQKMRAEKLMIRVLVQALKNPTDEVKREMLLQKVIGTQSQQWPITHQALIRLSGTKTSKDIPAAEIPKEPENTILKQEVTQGNANPKNVAEKSDRTGEKPAESTSPDRLVVAQDSPSQKETETNGETTAGRQSISDSSPQEAAPGTLGEAGQPLAADNGAGELPSIPAPKQATRPDPISYPEKGSHYIRHAGLVLLHPYLPLFFRTLKLADETAFFSETAQSRAVHLLQYLAIRESGLPEYQLLLPKLLCGLPFAIPMEKDLELLPTEREEAEALLAAAIQHWGALGDVSPDALREGFLQRDGKLEFKASGWHLTVEKKAFDLLLTKLPWGIGMIKLPWMPDRLSVKWI